MTTETNMDYEECRCGSTAWLQSRPRQPRELGGLSNENSFSLAPLPPTCPRGNGMLCARRPQGRGLGRAQGKGGRITRVLAKVSTEDMVVLRCLVGEDRAAQASRYIALKGLR